MSLPLVVAVHPGSPAHRAGIVPGDLLVAIDGERPRDVIRYQLLTDGPDPVLEIERGGLERSVPISKGDGESLGLEVESALFDQVRTCDNHCSFCFIYQLPPGLRKSLYLKDDDFRLSFLYGNFTTLTRFTEADLERVVSENLSPLYVSIHATDPEVRSRMLRNRRGATSLRWLRALLDHGVAVHGQIVVCPGQNDGAVLEQTLAGVLDEYPELQTVAVVPLGVSDHSTEPDLRPHTRDEAAAVVDIVEAWQAIYHEVLGRRLVFAADEYYLLAGRPFPPAEVYGGFPMYEDGIGMARSFELEFSGRVEEATGPKAGFFAWVDGAPAEGYRAPRTAPASGCGAVAVTGSPEEAGASHLGATTGCGGAAGGEGASRLGATTGGPAASDRGGVVAPVRLGPSRRAPIAVITGTYGARVLGPLIDGLGRDDVRIVEVDNRFFGGNVGVAGLLVGQDIARVLADQPAGHRYLLPDVCLSSGRFLDGTTPDDLPHPVEVVPTDGIALRQALDRAGSRRAVAVGASS